MLGDPKKYGLQIDKILLWAKTGISSLVPQILSSDSRIWFRDECCL